MIRLTGIRQHRASLFASKAEKAMKKKSILQRTPLGTKTAKLDSLSFGLSASIYQTKHQKGLEHGSLNLCTLLDMNHYSGTAIGILLHKAAGWFVCVTMLCYVRNTI